MVSGEKTGITPQQKRRDATAQRLREALARLLAQERGAKLSVAALAREAGVGRNAIYVNHRDVVAELLQAASHRIDAAVALKEQLRGLATENARLLRRAQDAEQATARAEKRAAKLDAQLRALRSRVHLYGTEPNTRSR